MFGVGQWTVIVEMRDYSPCFAGKGNFATMSRCGRSKSMSPQNGLAGLTISDYVLSCVLEPAGYTIYHVCKCNI